MIQQILVNLKWDEPEKPAGTLIIGSGDWVRVGQLLGQVRETCKKRRVFGTEGLYRVIEEIFNDEGVQVKILHTGRFEQMEVRLGYYVKRKNEICGDLLCPHCIATLYPRVEELYGDIAPKLVEIFHFEDEHLTAVNNHPIWVIGVVHPTRGRINVEGCRNWETWINTWKSGRKEERRGRFYWADCKKCPDHVHGLFGFHFCKGEVCHEIND